MTGLLIVGIAVAATLAFGLYRRAIDGRAHAAPEGTRLTDADLGSRLGKRGTLVQFSSQMCSPCRPTRVILADVARSAEDVEHIEVDAEARLDLAERFDVVRTPTVIVLDGAGVVRQRIVGAPKRADVVQALEALTA